MRAQSESACGIHNARQLLRSALPLVLTSTAGLPSLAVVSIAVASISPSSLRPPPLPLSSSLPSLLLLSRAFFAGCSPAQSCRASGRL